MSRTSGTMANSRLQIAKLAFQGLDGDECEEFVASVRRLAYSEGKERDDEWKLDLVTACLKGKALRWHASLDQAIKQDWDLFVQALLEQYPANSASSSLSPTPAAARPISASAAPWSRIDVGKGQQVGKLRLVGTDFPGMDYIASRPFGSKVYHEVMIQHQMATLGPAEADVVRFIQRDDYIGIYMSMSRCWLGVAWDDETGVGIVSNAGSTLTESPTAFDAIYNVYPSRDSTRVRKSASQIWRIEADGTLSATRNSHGVPSPSGLPLWTTTIAVNIIDQTMCFVNDFEEFVNDAPRLYYEARLVFEPMSV